jgi:TonB family protein
MVSKSVVNKQFIAAMLCGSIVAGAALAQQKSDDGVRLHCPLLSSHPVKIVRPVYPELAKETRVQGRVSLVCLVSKDGNVKSIEVKAGHPLLLKAATDAVSQWKFKPLLLNGEAVEFEAPVNVDFQLPKAQKNPTPTKPTA